MEERKYEELDNLVLELEEKVVESEQKKRLNSLSKMLMIIIVICWLVPITIIFVTMSYSYRKGIVQKTKDLLQDEVRNFAVTVSYNVNEGINVSKNLSYDNQLEDVWRAYKKGSVKKPDFYKKAASIVRTKFYHDSRFTNAVFYLSENPSQILPNSLTERQFFHDKIKRAAYEITQLDSPAAYVKVIDGQIYIIRNLYTTRGYTKFGTLVVGMNTEKLFEYGNKSDIYKMFFFIDDSHSLVTNGIDLEEEKKSQIINQLATKYQDNSNNKESIVTDNKGPYQGYLFQQKYKDYRLGTALIVRTDDVYSEIETLTSLIVILVFMLLPVVAFMIYFVTAHVTTPIHHFVVASKEMRSGKIGVQIKRDKETMPNQEFAYLLVSFNKMSSKIKDLFEFAHSEQLARKEAKILALQSQINPHFLNNTLEMMNWQARMSGDIPVSKMIEALSTLLEFSLDRSNKRLIYLSDELRCADAYCYIMSQRFGQRLQVEKEIDESLRKHMVPQLILQPLLENAVMHGVERIKRGTIWLRVYRSNGNIILEVRNTGEVLSEENCIKIKQIIEGEIQVDHGKGKHVSLGIRNVNERIRLLYGKEYGLTIESVEEGITSAKITIPEEQTEQE